MEGGSIGLQEPGPQESRVALNLEPFDSASARVSVLPTSRLALQVSVARLQEAPTVFLAIGSGRRVEAAPAGARDATRMGGLLESSLTRSGRHTLFGRVESGGMPAQHAHGSSRSSLHKSRGVLPEPHDVAWPVERRRSDDGSERVAVRTIVALWRARFTELSRVPERRRGEASDVGCHAGHRLEIGTDGWKDGPIHGRFPSLAHPPRCLTFDMRLTCTHADHMSKMVQIRNVPEALHRKLKVRAADAGQTLSDYLLAELERVAARPTRDEMLTRLHSRRRVTLKTPAAKVVREERESA